MTLDQFIQKYQWKRVDYDWSFGYQCNDLTRFRLQVNDLPQYKNLWNKGVKYIALQPFFYIIKPLERVKNDTKDPNQVPNRWDIVIFGTPTATGHIAIVTQAERWINQISIFEQNGGKGTWTWLLTDSCRINKKTYKNVLGRISLWLK